MRKNHRNEIALGLLIIAAAAILGYLSLKIGGISIKEGVEARVILADASGLVEDADVMIAGVKVGSVKSLTVEHDRAIITIVLSKDAVVRNDVKAGVRSKSLLGEKYLALIPASTTAPLIMSGDVVTEAEAQLAIDQLINAMGPILKAIDPEDVRVIVKTLSSSLDGKSEAIGNTISNMEAITGDLRAMVSESRPRVGRIVESMDILTEEAAIAFYANRPVVERAIANAEKATTILSEKAPQLADDISTLSTNLRTVSESLMEDYPKYSGRIDKVTLNLMRITEAFSEKSPQIAEDTATAVNNISSATSKLPQALDNFNQLAPELESVLKRADSVLNKADNITREDVWKILREMGVRVRLF